MAPLDQQLTTVVTALTQYKIAFIKVSLFGHFYFFTAALKCSSKCDLLVYLWLLYKTLYVSSLKNFLCLKVFVKNYFIMSCATQRLT